MQSEFPDFCCKWIDSYLDDHEHICKGQGHKNPSDHICEICREPNERTSFVPKEFNAKETPKVPKEETIVSL